MIEDERELSRILFRDLDKPERLLGFYDLRDKFSPEGYWDTLGDLWEMSESLYADQDLIAALMKAHPEAKHYFMSKDEKEFFGTLKFPLHIYRGGWAENIKGWSWTLDKERAVWFANRCPMDGKPLLAEAWVAKQDVIGYKNGRSEQEIVVDPALAWYRGAVVNPLPPKEPEPSALLYQAVQSGNLFPAVGNYLPMLMLAQRQGDVVQVFKQITDQIDRLMSAGLFDAAKNRMVALEDARKKMLELEANDESRDD